MASKKSMTWRQALPRQISELQRATEKRLTKGWNQVMEMLPPAPRKTVKELTANVDKMRHTLQKRGDKVIAELRKRGETVRSDVQKRLEGAVTPLTRGLDVASRSEVDRLRKRLEHLERRLESRNAQSSATA